MWCGSATAPCSSATPDGTLLWHGIMLDITDQKLIEQQLERQSARAGRRRPPGRARARRHADRGAARGGLPHRHRGARHRRLRARARSVEDGETLTCGASTGGCRDQSADTSITHRSARPGSPGPADRQAACWCRTWTRRRSSSRATPLLIERDQEQHLRAHRGAARTPGACSAAFSRQARRLHRARRQLRGRGRQHPRGRDRAPGRRGRDAAPRAARRAHRPAEPQPLRRPPGAGARARAPAPGLARSDPVHRRRPLQAGQRLARPPGRRRAPDRRRHAPARGGAPDRHGRALRRRRVRPAARGDRERARRDRDGRADRRQLRAAVRARLGLAVRHRQHRHRAG